MKTTQKRFVKPPGSKGIRKLANTFGIYFIVITWSATIRMFPNNSRSAVSEETKRNDEFLFCPGRSKLYLQRTNSPLAPLELQFFTTEPGVTHGTRTTLTDSWPHLTGRPQNRGLHAFQYTCLQGIPIIYIYMVLINWLHLWQHTVNGVKNGLPSTLRACPVYSKSKIISRMTAGKGNLSVLNCSLDCQAKGKISLRLKKM